MFRRISVTLPPSRPSVNFKIEPQEGQASRPVERDFEAAVHRLKQLEAGQAKPKKARGHKDGRKG